MTSGSERWRRIEELFHQSLEQPAGQREQFLDDACGPDAELRAEVASLLTSHSGDTLSANLLADVAADFLAEGRGPVGQTVGRYRVDALIGAGGMGEVYKAIDPHLERPVALKVLTQREGPDAVRYVLKEARAASAVNHANVAVVYEAGEADGLAFIAMEFVEGETLEQKLAHGPLPTDEAVSYAIQVCGALEEAHARGVIHRDIKPGNIMITPRGTVKVLDFGLAKAGPPPGSQESRIETDTRTIVGTLSYMSPEQLLRHKVGPATDLFSLGIVLCQATTGVRPLDGSTPPHTVARILHDEPSLGAVPPGLRAIVERCLKKDPAQRFGSAAELRRQLDSWAAAPPGPVPGEKPPLLTRRAAAGLMIAGSAAAGVLWLTRSRPSTEVESLAVLPLDDRSEQKSDYFADGMTEALTSRLARIEGLRVISRTSATQFRDARLPLRDIANRLGADGVIEGSVMRSGDRVRISIQLIHASSDVHLWSHDYEGSIGNAISLQREVSADVARQIQRELRIEAGERRVTGPAYEAFLRARHHANRRSKEDLERAVALYSEATRLEPDYAEAYAGLAETYTLLTAYAGRPPAETYAMSEAAARKALEIDEALPEAHACLATVEHEYNWNQAVAEHHYQLALAGNPSHAPARQWYGEYLTRRQRHDEAVSQLERGRELDPLSLITSAVLGWGLMHARRYEAGIARLRSTLELDPAFAPALGYLGEAYAATGRFEEGRKVLEKAIAVSGRATRFVSSMAALEGMAGSGDRAGALVQELLDTKKRQIVPPMQIAMPYLAMGRDTDAWPWIEQAFAERGVWSLFIGFHRLFDRLRGQPRFDRMVEQAGLN